MTNHQKFANAKKGSVITAEHKKTGERFDFTVIQGLSSERYFARGFLPARSSLMMDKTFWFVED